MSELNVDPSFSIFGLLARRQSINGTIHHRKTMSIISHEIENATIVERANTTIFAGFQYMSKFLRQEERYRKLAREAKRVYVFGVVNCPLPGIENVVYVPLESTDQLTKEWFLISYGERYFSALATEELTSINDPDDKRIFKGIWTFQQPIVAILHDWLADTVGLRRLNYEGITHDLQSQFHIMNTTMERLNKRIMKNTNEELTTELKHIVSKDLLPTIWDLQSAMS